MHIPGALNDYKEFLRGQNHYDSFILSGVSGRGARSFYYPPKAEARCAGCHMPLITSRDFGARPFDDSGALQIHDHRFIAANTGVAHLRNDPDTVRAQQAFLDKVVTLDIFGLREGGTVSGRLIGPLGADAPGSAARPALPGGDRAAHAQGRPPLHPGHGRFQRGVGGARRRGPATA